MSLTYKNEFLFTPSPTRNVHWRDLLLMLSPIDDSAALKLRSQHPSN